MSRIAARARARPLLELSKDGNIAVEAKRDGNHPMRYRSTSARPAAGES